MTTTIGAYTLTDRLPGEGEIYLATSSDGRRCLLRLLPVSPTDARVERARSETLACAALAHPAVGVVNDLVAADDKTGIVSQEPLDGATLAELIAKLRKAGQKLGPAAVWHLGHQVAAALALAHSSEVEGDVMAICHGHLSPHQVAISWDGGVRIEGMGLGSLVGVGGIQAQPGYQAPEEERGGRVTPRGDIYSLGAILWEMLSGSKPHEGMTVDQLEGVPASLADPFARALESSLSKRRITSMELEQYLDELRGDQGKKVLVEAMGLLRKGGTLLGLSPSESRSEPAERPPQLGRVTDRPQAPKMPPLRPRQSTLVGGGPKAGVDWSAAVEAAAKPSAPSRHEIADELSWGGEEDTTRLAARPQLPGDPSKTGEETTLVTARSELEAEAADEDEEDITRLRNDLGQPLTKAARAVESPTPGLVRTPGSTPGFVGTPSVSTPGPRPVASSRRALSRPGMTKASDPPRDTASEPGVPSIKPTPPRASTRPLSPAAAGTPRTPGKAPVSAPEVEIRGATSDELPGLDRMEMAARDAELARDALPESLSALSTPSERVPDENVPLNKTLASAPESEEPEGTGRKSAPEVKVESLNEAADEPPDQLAATEKRAAVDPDVEIPPTIKAEPAVESPAPRPERAAAEVPASKVPAEGAAPPATAAAPSPWSPDEPAREEAAVAGKEIVEDKPISVIWSILIIVVTSVVVMILGTLWVRRHSTVNPPTGVPSSMGAEPSTEVSSAPSASAAPADTAPVSTPDPSVAPSSTSQGALAPPEVDASKLAPNMGYLMVKFDGPPDAEVVLFGKVIGKVNQPNETQCRRSFVRLRAADGITWVSEGKPVVVECRAVTELTITKSK